MDELIVNIFSKFKSATIDQMCRYVKQIISIEINLTAVT